MAALPMATLALAHTPDVLIFDWDGTLLNSVDPLLHMTSETGLAVPQASPSHLMNRVLEMLYSNHPMGLEDMRVVLGWEQSALATQPCQLFDGVASMLERLARSTIPLALISGRKSSEVRQELRALGLEHTFQVVLGQKDAEPKPSPQLIDTILSRLGARPERSVLIGDATVDMEMATLAGIPAVGVAYAVAGQEAASRETLHHWHPLKIVSSVCELADWLEAFCLGSTQFAPRFTPSQGSASPSL